MSGIKLLTVIACAGSLLVACSGTPVALGPHGSRTALTGTPREIGSKACGFQLLLFIPISINGRMERAYQRLESQAGGDPIVDIQVQETWTYGVVGTAYCTKLKAKVLRTHAQP